MLALVDLGGRGRLAAASPSLYLGSSKANDWVPHGEAFKSWTKDADCHILQLRGSDGSGGTTLVCFLVKDLEKSSTVLSFFASAWMTLGNPPKIFYF